MFLLFALGDRPYIDPLIILRRHDDPFAAAEVDDGARVRFSHISCEVLKIDVKKLHTNCKFIILLICAFLILESLIVKDSEIA